MPPFPVLLFELLRRLDTTDPTVCWVWKGSTGTKGYGTIYYQGRNQKAHRVMWEMVNAKKIPKGRQACHTCDNPPCCNPDHIFIGLPVDNTRDRQRKGRPQGHARLTCLQAARIIELYREGRQQKELAALFKICQPSISKIVNGKQWPFVLKLKEERHAAR